MQVIALIPTGVGACQQIREALSAMPSPWEVQVEESLLGLSHHFGQRTAEGTPLVLMAEDGWVMSGLLVLNKSLSRFRILFILDTSDPAQVQQAHRLQPRVVIDTTDAPSQIPTILQHMKAWD